MLRPVLPATNFVAPEPPPPAASVEPASPAAASGEAPSPALTAPRPSPQATQLFQLAAREADPPSGSETTDKSNSRLSRSKVDQARRTIQPLLMTRIDLAAAVSLPRKELVRQLEAMASELLAEHRLQLNRPEQSDLEYFNTKWLKGMYKKVIVFSTNTQQHQTVDMMLKPGFEVLERKDQYYLEPDPAGAALRLEAQKALPREWAVGQEGNVKRIRDRFREYRRSIPCRSGRNSHPAIGLRGRGPNRADR